MQGNVRQETGFSRRAVLSGVSKFDKCTMAVLAELNINNMAPYGVP
jgi:hypothetical protein